MRYPSFILFLAALSLLTACRQGNGNPPVDPVDTTSVDTAKHLVPSPSLRQELYRPQVHYSVHHNWSNDPNGLFYKDGIWHLYYQYNPDGIACDFGRFSWGHATSSDLMHWQEHAPVLYPDDMGAMFSGCAVVDLDNRAGFGAGAILAFYTASSDKQKICLAVSTDDGMTFTKYANNPIIPSIGLDKFRDPKVVWDEQNKHYVMLIARGWDQGLEFWRSTNLMDWEFVPYIFHADAARCNLGQYECPDLLHFDDKWVLVLSTNPGGYINGSGTMYFVGSLTPEGYFVADEGDYPMWLDYGADNYAGVTWNNAPDNRQIMIAWMNNWDYAPGCPTYPWKSAFTLPREYDLKNVDGRWILTTTPVHELDAIARAWTPISETDGTLVPLQNDTCLDAYQLAVNLYVDQDATIRLSNDFGEYYEVRLDSRCHRLISDRSRAGVSMFSSLFAVPSMAAPIETNDQQISLQLIVDQSSIEMFTSDGTTSVTNTVYPRALFTNVQISGHVLDANYRLLETIWK